MSSKLFIRTVFTIFLFCHAWACKPIFRLYEPRGWGEDYIPMAVEYTTIHDEPDIQLRGFIQSSTRTCPLGVWMGYEYPNYFGGTTFFADNDGSVTNCKMQSGPDYFRSIRRLGNPDDYSASAVITFLNRYNEWAATTYLNDTQQLINTNVNSMIILGSTEVEVFTEANFQGRSFCIGPNNGAFHFPWDFEERNGWRNGTELYTNMADLETVIGVREFHSLKFGCTVK